MSNSQLLELQNPPLAPHDKGALRTADYSQYSDEKLMQLCKKYGTQTILWRQQFIGLLPEVNRRKLYEKKGFSSIVEFGKRMAGLSEAQIRLAINLEKKFEDKPELHSALIDGKISINKLVRVASIATVENESELAKCASVLSKSSLDVLVKDMGNLSENGVVFDWRNGLFEPQIDVKSLPGHTEAKRRHLREHDDKGTGMNPSDGVENGVRLNFQLNIEVIEKLNALHEKGIDVNEIILKMLEKRETEIVEKKECIVVEVAKKEEKRREEGEVPSRYISVKTKRILSEEYGTKCGVVSCKREAVHLHHTLPFALGKTNDPNLLKPLCREHHDILHSVNTAYLDMKFRN